MLAIMFFKAVISRLEVKYFVRRRQQSSFSGLVYVDSRENKKPVSQDNEVIHHEKITSEQQETKVTQSCDKLPHYLKKWAFCSFENQHMLTCYDQKTSFIMR